MMAEDASDPVRVAVQTAYGVFSRYRLSGPLNVCKCGACVSEADELALRTTPLREISASLLSEYTHSAHGYGADEFLYFLPRYFDLIAAGEEPSHIGLEACLRRLGESECRSTLARDEASVCDEFFDQLLHALRGELNYEDWPIGRVADDIGDHVIMVAIGGGDMRRVLDAWDRDVRPSATVHIAAIIHRIGFAHLFSGEAFWPWSDGCRAAEQMFQAWLERPETADRIELLFLETENRADMRTLERAVEILHEVKRARERRSL